MSGTGKLPLRVGSQIANSGTLKSVIDSSLKRGSGLSIALSDATVGVSLDTRGDWTISVGLSLRSDRFHETSLGLERLGFFQAAENEGASYLLWTSLLAQTENVRSATEQVLAETVRILQAPPVSAYIS